MGTLFQSYTLRYQSLSDEFIRQKNKIILNANYIYKCYPGSIQLNFQLQFYGTLRWILDIGFMSVDVLYEFQFISSVRFVQLFYQFPFYLHHVLSCWRNSHVYHQTISNQKTSFMQRKPLQSPFLSPVCIKSQR